MLDLAATGVRRTRNHWIYMTAKWLKLFGVFKTAPLTDTGGRLFQFDLRAKRVAPIESSCRKRCLIEYEYVLFPKMAPLVITVTTSINFWGWKSETNKIKKLWNNETSVAEAQGLPSGDLLPTNVCPIDPAREALVDLNSSPLKSYQASQ